MRKDMGATSPQSNLCEIKGHVGKITDWALDEKSRWKGIKFGCTKCDWVGDDYPPDVIIEKEPEDHSNCESNPCFACKVKTLQMNAGDAKSSVVAAGTTQKKWDKELAFYKSARAQGVQPEGTSRKAVENALKASETLGKAYDGGTMPASKHISKGVAEVMKEIGK